MSANIKSEDEFGLGIPYPYSVITLDAEQMKLLKDKKPRIYEADGRRIFEEVIDNRMTKSGRGFIYVVFT